MTINSSYYFSDTIDYGNLTPDKYTLTNPQLISTLADYSDLVGKYMIYTGTNTPGIWAYYIVGINDAKTTIYYRRLQDGDIDISMMVGDNYTDNGNGTYTINNATTVTYIDWYNGEFRNHTGKYACTGVSDTCTNLKHIASYPQNDYYYYWSTEESYLYSETIAYSGGTYTLTGDIQTIWDIPNTTEQTKISTHHYTCLSTSTTCTTVNYVNHYSGTSLRYAQLSGVEDIDTALVNMLSANNVNVTDSTMKTGVDAWYKKYLSDYSSYLEDTIFCNNRSILSLGGWNPDGGNIVSDYLLQFKNHNFNDDLSCTGEVNQFSTSNNKAKLTYPVGLMTSEEIHLLYNPKARVTGQNYWLASPRNFNSGSATVNRIDSNGGWGSVDVSNATGVRPAISIVAGTEYSQGDGSMANPYVIGDITHNTNN